MATPVFAAVESAVRRANLTPDDLVLIGLSGGVDSLALTHALSTLQQRAAGPRLLAVHVNHQIRPESDEDAARVAKLAETLHVPVEVIPVDIGEWARVLRQGIEAAARAVRYAAFASVAQRLGTRWIALGHTRDDQAETVLLRLARGTSLEGLAGMRWLSERAVPLSPRDGDTVRLSVIRPLLGISRQEIEQYASENSLEPVEDASNRSLAYRRNVVRHHVVPALETAVPGAVASIARTAAILRDDADYLDSQAVEAEREVIQKKAELVMIAREPARRLHPALQRRIMVAAIIRAAGTGAPLSFDRIEALREAVQDGAVSTRIELGNRFTAYVDYETVAIGQETAVEDSLRRALGLPLMEPGTVVPLDEPVDLALGNNWQVRAEPGEAGTRWLLRTRQPGDRITVGDGHTIRLQDWFVNRKIPAYVRDWLPLLAEGGVVRWVGGISPLDFEDAASEGRVRLSHDDDRG
jgi:tRNA(Ile)-lysidine synthetase-like protein